MKHQIDIIFCYSKHNNDIKKYEQFVVARIVFGETNHSC